MPEICYYPRYQGKSTLLLYDNVRRIFFIKARHNPPTYHFGVKEHRGYTLTWRRTRKERSYGTGGYDLNLTAALAVGAAWYKLSQTYLNALTAFGFEGPGVVNIEQMQRAHPDWVEVLKTEHTHGDDPEYWLTLLKQISTMWWTPLDYTADDFQKISEPVLILMGDRDGTIPVEQAVEMYELIPNAELAILPNATHGSAINEFSLSIVLDFLLRHSASAE